MINCYVNFKKWVILREKNHNDQFYGNFKKLEILRKKLNLHKKGRDKIKFG